jgi:UDP-N-acetylglucosamine--N-acetylmuramyl-(pentapeptide) pyrophosphoryl-undecaprenol N-acetylglucosamine transferase
MRIAVSGGGTAGHISPALAVCDALKALDPTVELLYIGQADSMEARIVGASGLDFVAIKAGKFRRQHSAGALAKVFNAATIGPNARDAVRTMQGVAGTLRVLRHFRPDVIFLKGGYVCLPVGLAARLLHIPYVIHESDLSPGLANRILSRWATKIAVGFPAKSYHGFDSARLVFTGNPVRAEILKAHRLEGLAAFKLQPDLPTILITGGSQGAAQINDAVVAALPQLVEFCQIIHQTGEGEFERLRFLVGRLGKVAHLKRYHPHAFILKDMPAALAVADLVIGRAGAGTIAESAVLGKPTVLIPNTQMAGHQVDNARVLSRAGAARVWHDAQLAPGRLVGEVRQILGDPAEQQRLGEAIRQFGRTDAADQIARAVVAAAGAGEQTA